MTAIAVQEIDTRPSRICRNCGRPLRASNRIGYCASTKDCRRLYANIYRRSYLKPGCSNRLATPRPAMSPSPPRSLSTVADSTDAADPFMAVAPRFIPGPDEDVPPRRVGPVRGFLIAVDECLADLHDYCARGRRNIADLLNADVIEKGGVKVRRKLGPIRQAREKDRRAG